MIENAKREGTGLHAILALAFAAGLMTMALLAGCASGEASSSASSSSSASAQASSAAADADLNVSITVSSPAADETVTYIGDVVVTEGATVLDAFEDTDLEVTIVESEYGPFVDAINGLASEGTMGWTYTLNGEQVQVSAGEQLLAGGDAIEWSYIDMAE